jgi:signal transduction histidine kinase
MSGIITDDSDCDDLQRFAELGRLSASLLHEISNPLSVALIHLDQVNDQTSHNIKSLRRSLNRLTLYVNAARGQMRHESSTSNFYMDSQIQDVKRLVRPIAKVNFVRLKINKSPRLYLKGDPLQFQQILVNLIVNAIEAYPQATMISPDRIVSVNTRTSSRFVTIDVADRGSGIAKGQLPKLFQPFYTTKGINGHGLGLGLVIVRRYIENGFKGSIRVDSGSRKGTHFIIKLPL